MKEAAKRVAAKLEADAAKAQADLDADLDHASKHKQSLGDGYWISAHVARRKAIIARQIANAIAEEDQ